MKNCSKSRFQFVFKVIFFFSLALIYSFKNKTEIHKLSISSVMMTCIDLTWNSSTECVTISNLAPTCSPVLSSMTEWHDGSGLWSPIPGSGQLCGCDVYEYLDVTPVCQVQGGNFILGGQQFNKCPGRCLTRTDFTFPQGSSNVVNFPACSQDINCIEITPSQLLANGGSMTAYYRSNTPSGTVVTILRFTYNGLGLNCSNINAQIVQRGKIYKHIFVRRNVTCSGGVTEVCPADFDIPQLPDNCLLEGFIGTVNLSAPCNSQGYSASTINLSSPATYQWKYNGINISNDLSTPSHFCLSGRPHGSYCAEITDASGCMIEVCRVHQSAGCTLGVTVGQLGTNLIASVSNCGPYMSSYQWSRWDGVSWSPVGVNSNSYNTAGLAGDYRVQVTCGPCMAYGNIVIASPLLSGPLPIVLQKFEAHSQSCSPVKLSWSTIEEQNSREYTIEKSKNGKLFEKIGQVFSHNKTNGSAYHFTDVEPTIDQTIFYRLRHFDHDGTENIHAAIKHQYHCPSLNPTIVISPNPASSQITINLQKIKNDDDDIYIKIRTIQGVIVKNDILINKSIPYQINIANLPAGIYTVEAEGKYLKTSTLFTKVD